MKCLQRTFLLDNPDNHLFSVRQRGKPGGQKRVSGCGRDGSPEAACAGRYQRLTRVSEDAESKRESCCGLKRACHTQWEWPPSSTNDGPSSFLHTGYCSRFVFSLLFRAFVVWPEAPRESLFTEVPRLSLYARSPLTCLSNNEAPSLP